MPDCSICGAVPIPGQSYCAKCAASRPVPPAVRPQGYRTTVVEAHPAGGSGLADVRRTRLASPEEVAPRAAPEIAQRKIVGVLLTFSWDPAGQLFPVREGRNLIGRGKDCDVCVTQDEALSEKHAHITFRKNFVIGDLVSMAGTYLNSEPVEEQFAVLPDRATIRTGSTTWTFIALPI